MSLKQATADGLDAKHLDQILNKMITTVSESKDQIFEIGEHSRKEYEILDRELKEIKLKVSDTIEKHDQLEIQARLSRNRLAEVSKNFKIYSEAEVRETYEQANHFQIELSVVRETEHRLRERRDEIERRLQNLKETVSKAEKLVGQVSVVLNFLSGDLKKVSELVEDAKQKQAFGLKIIEAQEEERKRLSREIHDGPAQLLAHVLLGSDVLDRIHRDQGQDAALQEIAKFRKMIKNALYEVRRIIYDLRPMTLDDLGLIPTLQKYLSRMKEQSPEIHFELRCLGTEERLPGRMEAALFRLVQEAVQNAMKHAAPSIVNVTLEFHKGQIMLVIRDDGRGFDILQVKDNSFGLIGMRERVDLLEGKISIQSQLNEGTQVLIKIPLLREGE